MLDWKMMQYLLCNRNTWKGPNNEEEPHVCKDPWLHGTPAVLTGRERRLS